MTGLALTLGIGAVRAGGGAPAPTGPLDFIGYGQSNWLFHVDNTSGQPAAHPDTFMWNFTTNAWVTPTGNGLRTFLNAMQAATGRVCRMVYGGQGGVALSQLVKGTANYTDLLARIAASGADPAFILWHQGEGNANTPSPTIGGYRVPLAGLHADICADTGKTLSQLPFICSSLGTVDSAIATTFTQPDSSWQTIQDALAGVNADYPNMHYSHSNMDAVLTDGIHWDGPSYGRSGARYARTVQVLMGLQTIVPKLFATAAERLTNTTTRIDLTHSMGSDFTPTSGITGFEVSGNNGASWVSATGARLDADSITLTHSDLGTTARLIRYQYGKLPDVSGAVKDSGSLAVPLNFTSANLSAAGAAALPVLTYSDTIGSATTNTTQTITGFPVPGSSAPLLAVIGIAAAGVATNSCTVTAQPSGTPVAATFVVGSSGRPRLTVYQASLPSGTTSVDVTVTFASSPFANAVVHVETMVEADLNSTTPVASVANRLASASTITANLATSAGGVVFAFGAVRAVNATPATITGDETYVERDEVSMSGATHIIGDASNTAASASSAVTATFGAAQEISIAAVSYR